MYSNKSKHRVNWTDGMKLSKQNFIDQENHFYEMISDLQSIHLDHTNFGLLPSNNKQTSLSLKLSNQGLSLYSCNGLTIGGAKIEITTNELIPELTVDLTEVEKTHHLNDAVNMEFVVLVQINPFKRISFGEIDVDEKPPRHPWVQSHYSLDVIPKDQFNQLENLNFVLPIALLTWKGKFLLHERFIPPCNSVAAHPALKEKYIEYQMSLNLMYEQSMRILRKIKLEGQYHSFNANVFLFVSEIGNNLSQSLDTFNHIYSSKSAINLLSFFSKLARVVRFSLTKLKEEDKILGYISDNSNISPAQFRDSIDRLLALSYNPMEIIEILDRIDDFFIPITKVFQILDSADMKITHYNMV